MDGVSEDRRGGDAAHWYGGTQSSVVRILGVQESCLGSQSTATGLEEERLPRVKHQGSVTQAALDQQALGADSLCILVLCTLLHRIITGHYRQHVGLDVPLICCTGGEVGKWSMEAVSADEQAARREGEAHE